MWSNVQVSSGCPAPSSRSKHAVCVAFPVTAGSSPSEGTEGSIYLLGGRSANLPLKDFWKFDTGQQVWEEIRTRGTRPPCLQEHTMVAWKNSLYVFGGEIGFASTDETPLWILDLNTLTWRKHHVPGSSAHQPSGRRGHSAVVFDGAMHIYGGYQDLRGSSSELWTFDFATERWSMTLVSTHVDQPPPRHSHSCVVHDGAMWVFGGLTDLQPRGDFWKWDFELQEWYRIKIQRGGPGELFSHAAVKVMAHMYIFGGERVGNTHNELWRYHFATDIWERVAAEGAHPPPKCRHVAIANPSLTVENGIHFHNDHHHYHHAQSSWSESSAHVHSHQSLQEKKPHPPKSLSMCFGQHNGGNHHQHHSHHHSENGKRSFGLRSLHHPVSRLCPGRTTSSDDEDEDDENYTVGYNHSAGQVNLRSLRERISSSRLVRSISSSSYSILHNQSSAGDPRHDEMEKLMEAKVQQQQQQNQRPPRLSMQKSQSSDAVLEIDNDGIPPPTKFRPRSEVISSTSEATPPIWVENPNASLSPTSWSDGHQLYGGHNFFHRSQRAAPSSVNGTSCNGDYNGVTTPVSRPSRLAYDGPLSTVKDVEEETSENADEANIAVTSTPSEMLVDLEVPEVDQERARYPSRFASSYTVSSDLLLSQTTTPSIESRGLPHSVSHSSGYHSFTDEEPGFEYHREFAGCLNTNSAARKMLQRGRDLELKTFTPNHQLQTPTEAEKTPGVFPSHHWNREQRARSWDRSYQRKQVRSYPCSSGGTPITPTSATSYYTADEGFQSRDKTPSGPPKITAENRPSRQWSRSPSKHHKLDQHSWNLCLYLFGGPEQGAPGVYRQPISIWKLYV